MNRIEPNDLWTKSNQRDGFTAIELVVSASMMVAAMAFVTTLAFRIDRTWKEIAYQRVAMNELSNHLDHLTQLPTDQIDEAIKAVEPSAEVQRTLANPKLTGIRIEDEAGDRILLKLDWKRQFPGRPVELIGWVAKEPAR